MIQTILHLTLAIHVVINLGVFARAMRHAFDRSGGVAPGMRLLGVSGLAVAVVHVAVQVTTPTAPALARVIGIGLCVGSLLLFRAADRATQARRLTLAFTPDQPTQLVAAGPYALIRHPFYTAYMLTWLGSAVGALRWPLWVSGAVMAVLYIVAALYEERKFARSPLGEEYAAYRRRTGLFCPRLWPASTPPSSPDVLSSSAHSGHCPTNGDRST